MQPKPLTDKSTTAIGLLRRLYVISRDWHLLYPTESYDTSSLLSSGADSSITILAPADFVNVKLTGKANRQLQDPLVIMTGHLPAWLPALVHTCPFLFPFETRLMYFYVASLDRDRALHKLTELSTELAAAVAAYQADATLNANAGGGAHPQQQQHHNERLVPKLERRKRTVNRSLDILRQADNLLTEFAIHEQPTQSTATTSRQVATQLTITSNRTKNTTFSENWMPKFLLVLIFSIQST